MVYHNYYYRYNNYYNRRPQNYNFQGHKEDTAPAVVKSEIENEQSDKVYKRYKEYCLANNFNPMSKAEFSKQLCRKLGMTTKTKKIGGKVYRIYIKQ